MELSGALWRGLVAGAIAGAVASWTMNQFQAAWSKIQQSQSGRQESQGEGEDATMKAANLVSRRILHRELTRQEKQRVAPYVHYGFGAAMGALYGVAAEEFAPATAGFGTAFATLLFLGADETAVPALKLSEPPNRYPLSAHLHALASHLVYGLSAEAVRRGVITVMEKTNISEIHGDAGHQMPDRRLRLSQIRATAHGKAA